MKLNLAEKLACWLWAAEDLTFLGTYSPDMRAADQPWTLRGSALTFALMLATGQLDCFPICP